MNNQIISHSQDSYLHYEYSITSYPKETLSNLQTIQSYLKSCLALMKVETVLNALHIIINHYAQ
jgi:hypothetical protein